MKKIVNMAALAICLMHTTMCMSACINESTPDPQGGILTAGTEAPDISFAATDSTAATSLRAMRGSYVMLEFWASWCPDCRRETAALTALYKEYAPKGVLFAGYSFDRDAAAWRKYMAANGMTWLQHLDTEGMRESAVAKAYGIAWIPTFYLIDRQGRVVAGSVNLSDIKAKLDELKL